MSGASMATGPRANQGQHQKGGEVKQRIQENEGALGGVMGSLRVVELQLVAFIIVFSASGLVPVQDLLFPVFISVYAFLLSGMVFPSYGSGQPPDVFKGNRFLQLYVVLGTAIGLFLPLAYVLGGFARGDQTAVRDAAPHLFLLSFQILSENVISGLGIFSLPVRALLPILYTTRRLFALLDWTVDTWVHTQNMSSRPANPAAGIANPLLPDYAWLWFGRSLAVGNTIYFSINLFAFLIPMFLPRAFEQYFNERTVYLAQHQGKHADHSSQQQKAEQAKKAAQPQPAPHQGREPEKKSQ